ncbi:MAG: hypothetical protein JNJ54_31435 [Myxococcaceae bacterium]|nr:hypothetical protein [Myxococcaceae bacterium]
MVGFVPDFLPDLMIGFDAVGAAEVAAGTYTAWDCGTRSGWRTVSFWPLDLRTLARDYARLPHVQWAYPNGLATVPLCGSSSDLCVEPSATGAWTWLALVQGTDCGETFFRLTTQPDVGRTIEQWDAGGPAPTVWFEQPPSVRDGPLGPAVAHGGRRRRHVAAGRGAVVRARCRRPRR